MENMFNTIDELKEWLTDNEFDDTIMFECPDYVTAVVGISEDNRLIYDYDKMAQHLVDTDNIEYDEACDFIDYNTLRALPYMGGAKPIILMPITN